MWLVTSGPSCTFQMHLLTCHLFICTVWPLHRICPLTDLRQIVCYALTRMLHRWWSDGSHCIVWHYCELILIIHWRSIAKRIGCFQWCVCVCVCLNIITFEWYKNRNTKGGGSPEFELGSYASPWLPHPYVVCAMTTVVGMLVHTV